MSWRVQVTRKALAAGNNMGHYCRICGRTRPNEGCRGGPDVAEVFRDPKLVNALLRATIAATEKGRSRRAG